MNSTDSQRPSRQTARASTTPPGASSRTIVSGSCIGTMPVSSSTVTVQIVFEPDIGGYSVGSMMMKPASQSSRVAGTIRLACAATLPRGSRSSRRRRRVAVAGQRLHLLEHRRARRREHAADHDVADLAAGVHADDADCAHGPHVAVCSSQPSPASASSASTISPASAVTPRSACSKIRAVRSRSTATTVALPSMPTRCGSAPEMPKAT